MAKFEVTKSFEAVKCNRRSGLPLGEPPITLSFGAILEEVVEDRDVFKFKYLGEPHRAAVDRMKGAFSPLGETVAASSGAASKPPTAKPTVEVAVEATGPALHWEKLASAQPAMRAKVPGGWLVSVAGAGLAFYPDPRHEWV